MRDESVRSRVTVPARRGVAASSVGRGSRQGRGGRIAASCAFRPGIRVISFNRRIVDSVSYMTREIELLRIDWHSENRGAASVLPFSGRTDLARC